MLASSASPLLALMATLSLFASTSALPARASTSRIARRAHMSRHVTRTPAAPLNDTLVITSTNPTTGKSHSVTITGASGVVGSTINVHFNGKDRRSSTSAPTNSTTPAAADDLPGNKATGDHSILIDASAPTTGVAGSGGIRNSTINLTVISRRLLLSLRSLFLSPSSPSSPSPAKRPVVDEAPALALRHVAHLHAHSPSPTPIAHTAPAVVPTSTIRFERRVAPRGTQRARSGVEYVEFVDRA